jgi:hypothetical protein
MDRLASDAAGLVLGCLSLGERIDGMAQVSRAWRVYTRTSLLRWARCLSLDVGLAYHQATHAGPVRFVQPQPQPQLQPLAPNDDAFHFVADKDTQLHWPSAPMKADVWIRLRGVPTTCHRTERIEWTPQDRDTQKGACNHITICAGAAIGKRETYSYYDTLSRDERWEARKDGVRNYDCSTVEYSAPLTVVSLTLTPKDIAWMAPVSSRYRLPLLCMLVSEDAAKELRTSLHTIVQEGAKQVRWSNNLGRMVFVLENPATYGTDTTMLVSQCRALLTLITQCAHLRESRGRCWWFDYTSLLDVFASQTEASLAHAVARNTELARAQDQRVQTLIDRATAVASHKASSLPDSKRQRRE